MSSRKAAPDCQRFWLKESDLKGSACQSIQIASNSLVIKCARHAARWRPNGELPNAEICEPRFSTQRSMRVISRCQVDRQISAKKHTKKNKERRPEKSEMRLIDRKRNRRHKSFIALASFLLLGELVNYTLVSAVLYGALKLLPCKLPRTWNGSAALGSPFGSRLAVQWKVQSFCTFLSQKTAVKWVLLIDHADCPPAIVWLETRFFWNALECALLKCRGAHSKPLPCSKNVHNAVTEAAWRY